MLCQQFKVIFKITEMNSIRIKNWYLNLFSNSEQSPPEINEKNAFNVIIERGTFFDWDLWEAMSSSYC